MKNKHYLILALLTASIMIHTTNVLAQCVIPITEGQSYTENFESGQMECWTVEATGTGTWAVMTGTASSVAAFQNAASGDEARLVSPTFDMSGIGSATFSFGYAMMGMYPPYDVLTVSYRTSETDSWHELGSYSLSDWQNVYDETFDLPDLSATYQISFLGHSNGGYYIFIDDIEIVGAGGCARPMNVQVTEITQSSALLGWSTTGNEVSWIVELDGDQKPVDVQPCQLVSLTPDTEYTFRVKALCDAGESEWSYPMTFRTLCDVITVTDDEPYFDDFEGSEDFICWQNEISSGEYDWVVDPGYLILNNTAFFIWMAGEAILYSAPLDITAVTIPTLEFKRRQKMLDGRVDYLYVAYRTSIADNWHVIGSFTEPAEDWETVTLGLPEASAEYQIAFDGLSNDADGVYVDDVRVGNAQNVGVVENPSVEATVSPNPASEKAVISTNLSDGMVTVFDLSGRKMTTIHLMEGRVELDLSGFAQGVYMARISNTDATATIKLVKE